MTGKNSLILLTLFLALVGLSISLPCVEISGFKAFDITFIDKDKGFSTQVSLADGSTGTIWFKYCSAFRIENIPQQCTQAGKAYAYLLSGTTCQAIVPSSGIERSEKLTYAQQVSEYNISLKNQKLSEKHPYNLNLSIECQQMPKNERIGTFKSILSEKIFTISTQSDYACPMDIKSIVQITKEYKWFIYPFLIVIGIGLCVAGARGFVLALFFIGFLFGGLLTLGVCDFFSLTMNPSTAMKLTMIGGAFLVGLVIGIAFVYFSEFCKALACKKN